MAIKSIDEFDAAPDALLDGDLFPIQRDHTYKVTLERAADYVGDKLQVLTAGGNISLAAIEALRVAGHLRGGQQYTLVGRTDGKAIIVTARDGFRLSPLAERVDVDPETEAYTYVLGRYAYFSDTFVPGLAMSDIEDLVTELAGKVAVPLNILNAGVYDAIAGSTSFSAGTLYNVTDATGGTVTLLAKGPHTLWPDWAMQDQSGTIVAGTYDVVSNTFTAGLPQSSVRGLTTALAALAPLASPVLTGTPMAPTAVAGDSSTQIATTAFVQAAVDAAVTSVRRIAGNWDASNSGAGYLYPGAGTGTGTAGAIRKGDQFYISVAGLLGGSGGIAVEVGDSVEAIVATPGQTAGNWRVLQANLFQATASQRGTAMLATDGETQTGTDAEKIITPARLAPWWTWIKTQALSISGLWTFSTSPVVPDATTAHQAAAFGQIPANTGALTESSNLYFTTARVLDTALTGLSTAVSTAVVAADSILVAIGKLQANVTLLWARATNAPAVVFQTVTAVSAGASTSEQSLLKIPLDPNTLTTGWKLRLAALANFASGNPTFKLYMGPNIAFGSNTLVKQLTTTAGNKSIWIELAIWCLTTTTFISPATVSAGPSASGTDVTSITSDTAATIYLELTVTQSATTNATVLKVVDVIAQPPHS